MPLLKKSIWFYLAIFAVSYVVTQAVITILVFYYQIEQVSNVFFELCIPVIIVCGFFANTEKIALTGRNFWMLYIGSLILSVPLSFAVRLALLQNGSEENLSYVPSVLADTAVIAVLLGDVVVRLFIFALSYWAYSKIILKSILKSDQKKNLL